jgi:hypothetical protein
VGLRETLNENPRYVTISTAALIVIVLAWLLWPSGGSGTAPGTTGAAQVYFSDDDGKTWFPDDVTKIPPFDHGGKQAVRARVYQAGGKKFVQHLERYTPDAQKKVADLYAKGKRMNDPTLFLQIQHEGMEVKLPGDKEWTKMSNTAASQKIITPKPPPGVSGEMEEINP